MGLFHVYASPNPHKFARVMELLPPGTFDGPLSIPDLGEAEELPEPTGLTCILREGETLFIPPGWMSHGEGACLDEKSSDNYGWLISALWTFQPKGASDGLDSQIGASTSLSATG